MMKTLWGRTTIVAAAVSAAFAAHAQRPPAPIEIQPDLGELRPPSGEALSPEKTFELLDGDGNGTIDPAEWRDQKMLVFYLLDRDRDMQLSPVEVPKVAPDVFAAADADGDGGISAYEFNQSAIFQFEAADVDDDGLVTWDEFEVYIRALHEE